MSDAELRAMRGAGVTMVFQEPMTSLNPLHTIERQIGEIIALHGGRAAATARASSNSDRGRHRRSGRAARRLSASAFGRPAPARDDRHGARQSPRSLHRRRADDRARRHRAGADPEAAEGPAGASSAWRCCSSPMISASSASIADDVSVMQHGRIVEAGRMADVFARPQHPYTKALLAAEPKGEPPLADASRADDRHAPRTCSVWFPIKRGFLRRTVGHVKAVDGVSLAVREGADASASSANPGSGKTTLGLAILRLIRSEGPIVYCGRAHRRARPPRRCARCGARCRSSSRTRSVRSRRACRSPRSSRKA